MSRPPKLMSQKHVRKLTPTAALQEETFSGMPLEIQAKLAFCNKKKKQQVVSYIFLFVLGFCFFILQDLKKKIISFIKLENPSADLVDPVAFFVELHFDHYFIIILHTLMLPFICFLTSASYWACEMNTDWMVSTCHEF